ncbi:unnamed protein product [Clavelina lepadiformis]|uniref:BHLH domain-containing protein n=1 Tax=Clavelina lepadiformis TaxID=159417 RepID=A0ABP0GB78_CLALP
MISVSKAYQLVCYQQTSFVIKALDNTHSSNVEILDPCETVKTRGMKRKSPEDTSNVSMKNTRTQAAGRERERLRLFNDAIDDLQSVIPIRLTQNRKLHKKQTLQLAIRYIKFLQDCLKGKRDWNDRNRFWCREEDEVVINAMEAAATAGNIPGNQSPARPRQDLIPTEFSAAQSKELNFRMHRQSLGLQYCASTVGAHQFQNPTACSEQYLQQTPYSLPRSSVISKSHCAVENDLPSADFTSQPTYGLRYSENIIIQHCQPQQPHRTEINFRMDTCNSSNVERQNRVSLQRKVTHPLDGGSVWQNNNFVDAGVCTDAHILPENASDDQTFADLEEITSSPKNTLLQPNSSDYDRLLSVYGLNVV